MTELSTALKAAGGVREGIDLSEILPAIAAAPVPENLENLSRLLATATDRTVQNALRAELLRQGMAFERDIEDRSRSAERLAALRSELSRQGLRGCLIPMADEYQNEYVPQRARRIAWLTGFTGSAGLVAVLDDRAAIFTDGRYTLQVRDQVDTTLYECRHISDEPLTDWLTEHLSADDILGYDPWLFTTTGLDKVAASVTKVGAELISVDTNPVDAVWSDQPPPPLSVIEPHDLAFAGETSAAKRQRLAETLRDQEVDTAVITAPDSIAWLLNIRGGDVARTPLPLSYAFLHKDGQCDLFVDRRKVTPDVERHLGNQVAVRPQDDFLDALTTLGASDKQVQLDTSVVASAVVQRLRDAGAEPIDGVDPCKLPKACKNDTELDGIRRAHRRDGVAETRFLHWLATTAQAGEVDEITAAETLRGFRRDGENFRDLSFDTISGAGPNGAIVHYRVTPDTNRRLGLGELYLVDSGAQYLDGTTDITRTVAIGEPTDEMRDRFTRVLKGHIAIARAVFPEGTTGGDLDILARQELWRAGLDYDHGTGHGVGCYLGVHEGPHSISKVYNKTPLKPGMIVSNEPGYYKTGAYGIRIENLVAVRPAAGIEGGERDMMSLETLTLAPIDPNLVVPELLTLAERGWLNDYHARVRKALAPDLESGVADWLAEVTRPI